jgi:hypothetical protein
MSNIANIVVARNLPIRIKMVISKYSRPIIIPLTSTEYFLIIIGVYSLRNRFWSVLSYFDYSYEPRWSEIGGKAEVERDY